MRLLTALVGLVLAAPVYAESGGLAGRASVIDGDTLEIHGTKIRLLGVDAVESSQQCSTKAGEQWPCGRRAANALSEFIDQQTVRCDPKDTDRYGRTVAVCFVGNQDLNDWMVREGWAVAYTRYSKAYVEAETVARAQGRNIWAGDFIKPEDLRRGGKTARTMPTSAEAPAGCAIKGNISSGGKVYHLPSSEWYGRTGIDTAKGERWFCSEAEAVAAGWRKAGAAARAVAAEADEEKEGAEEEEPTQQHCCKYCSKGKPCGNSCISRRYTCHQPPGCAC